MSNNLNKNRALFQYLSTCLNYFIREAPHNMPNIQSSFQQEWQVSHPQCELKLTFFSVARRMKFHWNPHEYPWFMDIRRYFFFLLLLSVEFAYLCFHLDDDKKKTRRQPTKKKSLPNWMLNGLVMILMCVWMNDSGLLLEIVYFRAFFRSIFAQHLPNTLLVL